jgi:hypothetical protein
MYIVKRTQLYLDEQDWAVLQNVAAYGLFQIAFTSLDTRVSRCLVKLCRMSVTFW